VSTTTHLGELSEKRALECVKSGLMRMHVASDAAPQGPLRLRVKFDRVLRHIGRLIAARQELGSALPQIHLVVAVTRSGVAELPDLVRLARELGVDALEVRHPCHDFGEEDLPAKYRPVGGLRGEALLDEDAER